MTKIWEWLQEWWHVIAFVSFCLLIIGFIVWAILSPKLTEGIVTNKWYYPGYSTCTGKGCEYNPAKYTVTIQNGEDKDTWYVSESYYDNVHVGDWVQK